MALVTTRLSIGSSRGRTLAANIVRHANGSAIISRDHSATRSDIAKELGDLQLNGAHSLGATSISLKAASDEPLRGKLPEKFAVVINGNGYTITADANASNSLIACTITPGLVQNEADEETVTLDAAPTYQFSKCQIRRPSKRDLSGLGFHQIGDVSIAINLPITYATVIPRKKDRAAVTHDNGEIWTESILEVATMEWGWRVIA